MAFFGPVALGPAARPGDDPGERAACDAEALALMAAHASMPGYSLAMTRLLNGWSHVCCCEGAISAWHELLERHIDDAQGCGDDALRTLCLGWLGNVRMFHGDVAGSLAILDRASAIGRAAGAREALACVTAWRALTLLELGPIGDAIACAQGLEQGDTERRAAPYAHAKTQGMLAIAFCLGGQFAAAREVSERLIAFGRDNGNCRASAFGHQGMSTCWLLQLDCDRAVREAQAGASASRDDLFTAMNQIVAASAAMAAMGPRDALRLCDEWMPYLDRHESRWFGVRMRPVQCSARIALGEFSAGLHDLMACVDDRVTKQIGLSGSFAELNLMATLVAIARREGRPSLRALLGNPWFTFTQAPFAARRAAAQITQVRADAAAAGRWGYTNLVDLADGRLQAHLGRLDAARECLARIDARRREAGLGDRPKAVREWADEIDRRAAGR